MHKVFQMAASNSDISFNQYWHCKRELGYSNSQILESVLNLNQEQLRKFPKIWRENIEKRSYLSYDKVFRSAQNFLSNIGKNCELVLVTNRRSVANTHWQLELLGVKNFFCSILITKGKRSKADLIMTTFDLKDKSAISNAVVIGDTEEDVECGHQLGCKTIAVGSGVRDEKSILLSGPNYLFHSLVEIPLTLIR